MDMPEKAFWAVIAALIAALISLVGLLISKDQKTTEFRQAWIDKLREDVSEMFSAYLPIKYYMQANIKNKEDANSFAKDFTIKFRDEIICAERVYKSIILRLNPSEHKHIIDKLNLMQRMLNYETFLNVNKLKELNVLEIEIVDVFQKELKKEWKRVKSGEPFFKIAKWVLIIIIAGVLIIASFGFVLNVIDSKNPNNQLNSDATENAASVN
jgi:hypothetical protein